MMYEMRMRKPEPTHLPNQVIFNLPHHIGTLCKELAFIDAVSYTQQENGLQHSKRLRIPVTAITFSCATIYSHSVYNLQRHQRSVPLIPFLHGVGGKRSIESVNV